MSALTRELRVQAGSQVSFATGVAPTVQLRGIEELMLRSKNNVLMLEDMSLGLAGASQAMVAGIGGEGSVKAWCSYEHLAYWLDNMFGQATPSGAGPYVRAYAAPIASAPTPRILSLVKGTSIGAYQLVGGLLSSLSLRLEQESALMLNGDLVGNKVATDALESLADVSVNPIMANQVASIYWDNWAGTMGATALDRCYVRMMELSIEPDRKLRPCFGSLTKDAYSESAWNGTLKLSLEFNATTKADVDAIIGGTLTQRQVEINFADSTRALKLQFAGTVTDDLEIFGDDDGVVTAEVTLTRTYHTTFGNWFKASLSNGVATLT
jgi:hypothetical protein